MSVFLLLLSAPATITGVSEDFKVSSEVGTGFELAIGVDEVDFLATVVFFDATFSDTPELTVVAVEVAG